MQYEIPLDWETAQNRRHGTLILRYWRYLEIGKGMGYQILGTKGNSYYVILDFDILDNGKRRDFNRHSS